MVSDVLADLGTYPHWNDLVQEATPTEPSDERPAWMTTLRAQVGPLARSKQLRFVRTVDETDADTRQIRFERMELDGREHAGWVMETSVSADGPDSCEVSLELSYSGGLDASARQCARWSDRAVDFSTPRLRRIIGLGTLG